MLEEAGAATGDQEGHLVTVQDLLQAVRGIQEVPDSSRLERIGEHRIVVAEHRQYFLERKEFPARLFEKNTCRLCMIFDCSHKRLMSILSNMILSNYFTTLSLKVRQKILKILLIPNAQ